MTDEHHKIQEGLFRNLDDDAFEELCTHLSELDIPSLDSSRATIIDLRTKPEMFRVRCEELIAANPDQSQAICEASDYCMSLIRSEENLPFFEECLRVACRQSDANDISRELSTVIARHAATSPSALAASPRTLWVSTTRSAEAILEHGLIIRKREQGFLRRLSSYYRRVSSSACWKTVSYVTAGMTAIFTIFMLFQANLQHTLKDYNAIVSAFNAHDANTLGMLESFRASYRYRFSGLQLDTQLAMLEVRSLRELGRYAKAKFLIEQLLGGTQLDDGDRSTLHVELIAILAAEGEFTDILNRYGKPEDREVLVYAPIANYATVLTNMGVAAASTDSWDSAYRFFTISVQLYSAAGYYTEQTMSAYGNVATTAELRGDTKAANEAMRACRQILARLPDGFSKNARFAQILNNIGYANLIQGQFAEAEQFLVEAQTYEFGPTPDSEVLRRCIAENVQNAKHRKPEGKLYLAATAPN